MYVLPCCQNGKGIAKTCFLIAKKSLDIKVNAFKTGRLFILALHNRAIKCEAIDCGLYMTHLLTGIYDAPLVVLS